MNIPPKIEKGEERERGRERAQWSILMFHLENRKSNCVTQINALWSIHRCGYQNSHSRLGASWDGFCEMIHLKQNFSLVTFMLGRHCPLTLKLGFHSWSCYPIWLFINPGKYKLGLSCFIFHNSQFILYLICALG